MGKIFNIQKFSIHDGPGIRTTVFLKGCPLRCKWCANPESQEIKTQILYDAAKCLRCHRCIDVCEHQAIEALEEGTIRVLSKKCTGCKKCLNVCEDHALTSEGEDKEVQEIVETCLKDKDFYEESGGGVTISGGEGMMQPSFVKELVQALKQENLHTAIETTGCVSKEVFQDLAPCFDLLLYDVKHYDSNMHKAGTGVSNEQIVENLKWAAAQNLNVLPRIPVIPGFNDSLEDARGIADLLRDCHLDQIQLLPFHQMGERKYSFLGREYSYTDIKAYHPEDLQDYRQVFLDHGIHAYF